MLQKASFHGQTADQLYLPMLANWRAVVVIKFLDNWSHPKKITQEQKLK